MLAPLTLVIAWGVLTFGAVYEWAWPPLLVATGGLGLLGFLQAQRQARKDAILPTIAFAIVAGGAALQLVPLPPALLATLSPAGDAVLRRHDFAYANGLAWRPLSIDPAVTLHGLMFLIAIGVFCVGSAASLATLKLPALARNIVILGVVVALLGIVQKATFNGRLYWFWRPEFGGDNAFGSFVNRNHFAGWMILSGSIGAGYLCALVATLPGRPARSWRDRILWLSSPDASRIILTSVALFVMSIALVWTLSRSGILGFVIAMGVIGARAARKLGSVHRRSVVAGYLLFAILASVGWRGTDDLIRWYGRTATLQWRLKHWGDSAAILKEFPLTGTGFNTYGSATMLYPSSDLTVHAVEAHNDYLQLAVEGGLLLTVPALVAIACAIGLMRRRLGEPESRQTRWIRAGALAGLIGISVQEISEFSLQIPGVAVLFAVLVAIAIHRAAPTEARAPASV